MEVRKYISDNYFEKDNFAIIRFDEFAENEAVFHSHDFVEICYVAKGSGYHIVGNKKDKVRKGYLYLINYDMSHTFYREEDSDSLVTYNILFTPGFLDEVLIDLNDFNSLTKSYLFSDVFKEELTQADLRLSGEDLADFDMLIRRMYHEYKMKKTGYMNIIRAYMIELLIKIMRYYSDKSEGDVIVEKNMHAIDSIIAYLHSNYSKGFSLNELALNSFFSKNYLCKIFKETTGITITEYMQTLRMNEAYRLLETTDMTITQIALEVGFHDYKSFNKVFQRTYRKSPSQIRNDMRAEQSINMQLKHVLKDIEG